MNLEAVLQADDLVVLQARAVLRQGLGGDGVSHEFIELRELVGVEPVESGFLPAVPVGKSFAEGRDAQLTGGGQVTGDQHVEYRELVSAKMVKSGCAPLSG